MLHAANDKETVPTQRELGDRLARAREQADMRQAELAEAVGLTQSAISRIESGERSVDSIELAEIARCLRVSVLDLLEDGPLSDALIGVAQRVEEATHPGAVDQALDRALELIRFDRTLTDLGLGRPEGPGVVPMEVPRGEAVNQGRVLAERVRKELCLDDDPIPELLEILEERVGLDVALEPLPEGTEGLCVQVEGLALVLVNSEPVVGRRRFTLAHELGHYLAGDVEPLHVDERLFGQSNTEKRANAFAAHLLMPEDGLSRWRRGRDIDERVVCELQYTFGVSLDALLWHMRNLGWIGDRKRRWLRDIGPRSLAFQHGFVEQWRASRDGEGRVRPPGPLYRRALEAYRRGLIGAERLAALLGYSDSDELRRELEDAGITSDEWPDDTASA